MNTAQGGSLDKLRTIHTELSSNLTKFKKIVIDYEAPTIVQLDQLADKLEKQQPFEQIPNFVPSDVITKAHNLENTGREIISALDILDVNRALEGREAYKNIADTLLAARNVTDAAMAAVEEAKTNESIDSLLKATKLRQDKLSEKILQLGKKVGFEQLSMEKNSKQLAQLGASFKDIKSVLQSTLAASTLTSKMSMSVFGICLEFFKLV